MVAAVKHVEHDRIDGKRLGRRPADPDRPVLRFAEFWTGATPPAHPSSADHFATIADWGMYGNDKFGDCGPTSVANYRKLVTKLLLGTELSPSQNDVYDLYKRSGNPNFSPTTGADDNGVDMAVMLDAVQKGGISGTRSLAYAKVDVSSQDECEAAIAIFGGILLGVDLQTAQQSQTDANPPIWDYKRTRDWGGHAIVAGKYTGASAPKTSDVSVVSWAEVVGTTDAFWAHQVEEAWIVIFPEHLGTTQFIQGIDTGALNNAYMALTGNTGPFVQPPTPVPTPTPTPTPTPVPTDANAALNIAFKTWQKAQGLS
jgi:hypothetical protein